MRTVSFSNPALRTFLIGLCFLIVFPSFVLACKSQETITQRQITEYEKLVLAKPDDLTNRGTLAGLYLQEKQYSKAIDQYSQILALQKDNVGALSGLGMTYMAKGDRSNARRYFTRVLELAKGAQFEYVDRRVEMAHFYLGTLDLQEKKYTQAVDQFNEALKSNRADADTNFMLGKALRGEGKLDEAIDAYNHAVALVPDMVEVYRDMADVYAQQGKTGERSYALGMIALFQRSYDKAIDSLTGATQSISSGPTLANAWFGLGYAWEKKGNTAKAADCYAQALKTDANNMLARQGLGRVRGSN